MDYQELDYQERRRILEKLLDHWHDFVLPSPSGQSAADEPLGFAFTSGMANHPSVRELDRCLGVLRDKMPGHYAHVCAWYASEWRTTEKPVKKRNAAGKMVDDIARVRVRVVPKWVVWRMVDRGLDIILALWGQETVLEEPPALVRKLREFTDQDGTHLTEAA